METFKTATAVIPSVTIEDPGLWFVGANPSVDIVLIFEQKILLICRSQISKTESEKWALPGGFVGTSATRGQEWKPGKETTLGAILRELREETGLCLDTVADLPSRMVFVGVFEGGLRDPRDTAVSWSQSHAFLLDLNPSDKVEMDKLRASDDASVAGWFSLEDLPELAFDHSKIVSRALGLRLRQ